MTANVPRSWLQLPKREQEKIEEYVKGIAQKEVGARRGCCGGGKVNNGMGARDLRHAA